jgi:threonine dehydratase
MLEARSFGNNFDDPVAEAQRLQAKKKTRLLFSHPFDESDVFSGRGMGGMGWLVRR